MENNRLKLYIYKPRFDIKSLKVFLVSLAVFMYLILLDAFVDMYCAVKEYTSFASYEYFKNISTPSWIVGFVMLLITSAWAIVDAVRRRIKKETLNDKLAEVYFTNLDTRELGCAIYDIEKMRGLILPMHSNGELDLYDIVSLLNNVMYVKRLYEVVTQDILSSRVIDRKTFKSYKILKETRKSITIDTIDSNGISRKVTIILCCFN